MGVILLMIINGQDIYMTRGDTESITLSIFDEEGNLIPFSNANGDIVYFTVKASTQTGTVSFQKTITIFTPEGEAIVEIVPNDTKDLRYGDYVYDVQINKNGNVTTVVKPAKFVIQEEVTYE